MAQSANSLYPIPLCEFVKTLVSENAVNWGERTMAWMVEALSSRNDHVFYHLSASNSSLSKYVEKHSVDLSNKTAHCDVQHSIWKLNLDAGNDKCPIDPLWSEDKHRFFRNGTIIGNKFIDRRSFEIASTYAEELSKRPFSRTGRGVICYSKDGCFCRSLEEVRVDDWLFDNGYKHEKEPNYPIHADYNKLGRKKADWKVNEILIEYAGLISDKVYEQKLSAKLALCKEMNITVVVLTRGDLNNLDKILGPALL